MLRSLCSGVLILLFSVTASVTGQRRTERVAPQATTAVSPNGQTIAIARSSDGVKNRSGRVELWDLTSGALQRVITGFDGPIWSISFSKDGKSLITVSTEFQKPKTQPTGKAEPEPQTAEIKWWDADSGEFLRRELLGSEGIRSVEASWSPAGDVVAVIERYARGQYEPVVRQIVSTDWVPIVELKLGLFDAHSLQRRSKIDGGQQLAMGQLAYFLRMAHPVFSSDGEMLAAVSGTDVKIWNVDSGKKLRTIREFNGDTTAIAFSPDGELLAVAAVNGDMPGGKSEIRVVEVATGKVVNKLNGLNDHVACLQFAAARRRTLLVGTLQYEPERAIGTVKIWDLVDNRLFRFNVIEGKTVSSMTVIPNRKAIVLQSGPDVELRDLEKWRVIHSFAPTADEESESMRRSPFVLSAKRALAVGFGSDGITVSSVLPREIRTWDTRTGGVINRHSREPVDVVATSSNGELIAEATTSEVSLTEVSTGAKKILDLETGDRISAIALSADGRSLVTANELGGIQFWEVSTGRLTKSFETRQAITALAVDGSGQMVAAATADRSIGLWTVQTGTLKIELKKQRDIVRALAFSPDGRTLASGGDDRNVILWELGFGKATLTFEKGDTAVTSIAFSPDGQLLASGAGNESVFLWNVKTGKLERILR